MSRPYFSLPAFIEVLLEEEYTILLDELQQVRDSDLFHYFQSNLQSEENGKITLTDVDLLRLKEQANEVKIINENLWEILPILSFALDLAIAEYTNNTVPPIFTSIFSLFITTFITLDENKMNEIKNRYDAISEQYEHQIRTLHKIFVQKSYEEINKRISEAKTERYKLIAESGERMENLIEIQKKLEILRQEIAQASR